MKNKKITIELESGLAARPIAVLVQVASQFNSDIYMESDGRRVNAKSIMGMMSLVLPAGETVDVAADGADEEQAMECIENYLTCRN